MTLQVTWQFEVPLVDIGNDVSVPERFTAVYRDESGPDADIEIFVEGGVPVCESITIKRRDGGPSLSGAEISRLPLVKMVTAALQAAALKRVSETPAGPGRPGVIEYQPPESSDMPDVALATHRASRRRHVTDELLRDVARIYKANDDAPVEAIRSAFTVSRGTAERYARLARERGYLSPTTPGRASR